MKKQSKLSALVLSLALLFVSGSAHAAFTTGMTEDQVKAEILAQQQAGTPLKAIAKAAKEAGFSAAAVTTALIKAGVPALDAAFNVASVSTNMERSEIMAAARAAAPSINGGSITGAVGQGYLSGLRSTASQGQQQQQQRQQQQQQQQNSNPTGGGGLTEQIRNQASPT